VQGNHTTKKICELVVDFELYYKDSKHIISDDMPFSRVHEIIKILRIKC